MPAVVQALLAENEGSGSASDLSDTLDAAFGTVVGSIIRRGPLEWEALPPENNADVLTLVSGLPEWVTPVAGGGGFSHSTTPPGSPSEGDRWVDEDTGIGYTYYNDGNTSQWVEL